MKRIVKWKNHNDTIILKGNTYYLDINNGSDSNIGLSTSQAFLTQDYAESIMNNGDVLLAGIEDGNYPKTGFANYTAYKLNNIIYNPILYGWKLNETNIGLAGVGLDEEDLTLLDLNGEDSAYGVIQPWNTWELYDDVVIEDKIITYELACGANNILRRCLIRPTGVGNGMPIVSGLNLTIEDCTIDASLLDDKNHIGLSLSGIAKRNNLLNMSTGIYAVNTTSDQTIFVIDANTVDTSLTTLEEFAAELNILING